jgi:hypothetical protein
MLCKCQTPVLKAAWWRWRWLDQSAMHRKSLTRAKNGTVCGCWVPAIPENANKGPRVHLRDAAAECSRGIRAIAADKVRFMPQSNLIAKLLARHLWRWLCMRWATGMWQRLLRCSTGKGGRPPHWGSPMSWDIDGHLHNVFRHLPHKLFGHWCGMLKCWRTVDLEQPWMQICIDEEVVSACRTFVLWRFWLSSLYCPTTAHYEPYNL